MRIRSLLLVVLTLFLTAVYACNGEGEGQPCDPNAGNMGNDDCASGLVCLAHPNQYTTGNRCCPQNQSQAKTFECCPTGGAANCSTSAGGADANPNPPMDSSSGDAPGESSTDSASGNPETGADASGAASPADTGAMTPETGASDAAEAASSADGGAG